MGSQRKYRSEKNSKIMKDFFCNNFSEKHCLTIIHHGLTTIARLIAVGGHHGGHDRQLVVGDVVIHGDEGGRGGDWHIGPS